MSSPDITIIIPVYNAELYLQETIDSIYMQTYQNWKLIIVNDGSTDKSLEIANSYAEKDERIEIRSFPENRGVAAARNYGVSLANTQYIAFIDSDDTWLPEKLEYQLKFMKENGYAFTFTEFCIIDESGKIIKERVVCPEKVNYRRLVTGNPIMCSSVILDISVINNFKMPVYLYSGEDYAAWARILRTNKKVRAAYCTGNVLSKYRKHERSLTWNKTSAFKRTWLINKKIEKMSFFKNLCVIIMYSFRWLIKHYHKTNKSDK